LLTSLPVAGRSLLGRSCGHAEHVFVVGIWIGHWCDGKQTSAPCLRCLASCLSWRWRRWFSAATRCTMASRCCAGRREHRAGRRGDLVVRGSPGGGCSLRVGGSGRTEAAWARRRGRTGCQRGSRTLERYRRLPAMALVEPLHGLTFALLHLACMQMLSVIIPPALAATAQAIYGTVAVGAMSSILSLISGPLYGAFGARAFWAMAMLCAAALPRLGTSRRRNPCQLEVAWLLAWPTASRRHPCSRSSAPRLRSPYRPRGEANRSRRT
jgi:hypothetical protein